MAFKEATANGFSIGPYTSVNGLIPSNTVTGDIMTAVFVTTNTPSVTPPSGWTLQSSGSMPVQTTAAVSVAEARVYTKTANSTDETNAGTGTYTWSTGTVNCAIVIMTSDPGEYSQFAKTELGTTVASANAPSVTTTTVNELVYHCCLKDGGNGAPFGTDPSGTVAVKDYVGTDTVGSGAGLWIVAETFASAGATGVKVFPLSSGTEEFGTFTFSITQPELFKPIVNFF
jgi:hypothetical protein